MDFSEKIRELEKRKVVSKRPHPVIPFVLSAVSLILGMLTINLDKFFSSAFFFLAGFSFIFAVLHLVVVLILKNTNKRKFK